MSYAEAAARSSYMELVKLAATLPRQAIEQRAAITAELERRKAPDADPPVRGDGRCAVCGGPRRLTQKPLYREQARLDPFCSAACCRLWHQVP